MSKTIWLGRRKGEFHAYVLGLHRRKWDCHIGFMGESWLTTLCDTDFERVTGFGEVEILARGKPKAEAASEEAPAGEEAPKAKRRKAA